MNRSTRLRPAARRLVAGSFALTALLAAGSAHAKDAAVVPFVSKGVDPMVVLNLTSLVSSEIDFMGQYDGVDQLEEMPSGMNGACLASPSCLGKVASNAHADVIVAGAVAQTGSKYDFYMVLYDSGRIVRTKDFTLPTVPSVVADSMGGYVKELITGKSMAKAAADAQVDAFDGESTADLFADEEDFEIDLSGGDSVSRRIQVPQGATGDDDLGDFDMFEDADAERQREDEARRKAEEDAARQRAADEARRRAEEDAARQRAEDEARRRAEEDARRRAEEEAAQRRADDERRRREAAAAAASTSSDDDEFDDLEFGSAADSIEVEEVTFKSAASSIVVDDDSADDDFASDDRDSRRSSSYDDLDEDRSSRRSTRDDDSRSSSRTSSRDDSSSRRSSRYDSLDDDEPARVKTRSGSKSGGDDTSAVVAARVGFSRFQDLSFITYGAEATFMPIPNLGLVGGVEAYSTRREIPPVLIDGAEGVYQWNTILPFNLGLVYRMDAGSVHPYAGGDVQFIPGYVKDSGGMATGLRIRGGADFMVADGFGFNLNVGAGFWSGQHFETVQRQFDKSALVPQISGGTVFAF